MQLCVDGWADEVAKRYGAETMAEIEWAAWNDQVVPELERMQAEFLPAGTAYDDPNQAVAEADRATTRVVYTGLFTPRPDTVELSKPRARHVVPREPRVPAAVHRGVGRPRSPSATASTRCSTSSSRCGATWCCPA